MDFQDVLELIQSNKYKIIEYKNECATEIYDLDFLGNDYSNNYNGTLFISNNPDIKIHKSIKNILTTYPMEEQDKPYIYNHIQVEPSDFSNIYHLLKLKLTSSINVQNTYYNLLKNILSGKNIEDIMNEVVTESGNHIVVLDLSGKILGNSKNFVLNDPLWMESIAKGYLPVEFMKHIEDIRKKNSTNLDNVAYVNFCKETQTKYLCSRIIVKNELLGYVFMFSEANIFNEDSYMILPLISQVAGATLDRSERFFNIHSSYLEKNILADLLAGIDDEHARTRIMSLGMEFPENIIVLLIKPSYYIEDRFLYNKIYPHILDLYPKSLSLIHQINLVLLLENTNSYYVKPYLSEKLYSILTKYRLRAGISNSFCSPTDFAIYYNQAKAALNHSEVEDDSMIVYYRDYAFQDMLSKFPESIDLERFCHPFLRVINEYDKKNGTDLFSTLRVYTRTGFNKKETAKSLFIHRNTLNYRREQINEILGVDIENENILCSLSYSFQIYSYLNNKGIKM